MSAFRFLLLAVLLIGSVDAAAREFTSQDGRKINGELLAHSGDQVIIKVGAKEFVVPVANFSLDDQQFIKEWVAANPGAMRFKFGYFFDVEKEREDVTQGKAAGSMIDDKLKTFPHTAEMIVFNRDITDADAIEIHYEIYIDDFVDIRNNAYTRMAVGGAKMARLETISGKVEVPRLAAGGRIDMTRRFNTEFYIDRDGGKTDEAATDKVLGIRLRILKGGKMIGEEIHEVSNSRGLKGIEWQNTAPTEGTVVK